MDRTTRKTLMMYGAFHLNSDINRLYLKQKHEGRGLISIEISVRSEKNNFVREKEYFKKNSQNEFKINVAKGESMDSFFR